MPDYKQSKIFKIVPKTYDNDNYDVFYGSTTQNLSVAFSSYKRKYKAFLENKHDNATIFNMFDKYSIENLEIVLIENIEYNNKEELHAKLRQYIENNICINKVTFIPKN